MGDKVPYLVFVGKWVWQIDTLHAYIDNQGYEDDWLFIFNGISDVKMETLYKRAMFTVYPSFAEGFGLPIGESLAYGKPCLARTRRLVPEVGREFVRYFDPFDWQTALDAIRRPIVDRADLQAWQDSIANSFKPKSWRDFCDEFYQSAIECAVASSDDPDHALPLLPASVITGGDHDILVSAAEDRPIITFRAARARNWHGCEHWECGLLTVAPKLRSEPICRKVRRPRSSCACTAPARVIQTQRDCRWRRRIDHGDADTQHPTYYRFLAPSAPTGPFTSAFWHGASSPRMTRARSISAGAALPTAPAVTQQICKKRSFVSFLVDPVSRLTPWFHIFRKGHNSPLPPRVRAARLGCTRR
jgi:hypothetical protein